MLLGSRIWESGIVWTRVSRFLSFVWLLNRSYRGGIEPSAGFLLSWSHDKVRWCLPPSLCSRSDWEQFDFRFLRIISFLDCCTFCVNPLCRTSLEHLNQWLWRLPLRLLRDMLSPFIPLFCRVQRLHHHRAVDVEAALFSFAVFVLFVQPESHTSMHITPTWTKPVQHAKTYVHLPTLFSLL